MKEILCFIVAAAAEASNGKKFGDVGHDNPALSRDIETGSANNNASPPEDFRQKGNNPIKTSLKNYINQETDLR